MERPEGKISVGRHRFKWEDNIKTDLQKVVWEILDWINLAQGRDSCRLF